jgi:hypothetical protein
MTASTLTRSAYPARVADLLPRARALAADLGQVPSQNRIKAEFKVGTDKARQLRGALLTDQPTSGPTGDPGPADAPTNPPKITPAEVTPLVAPVTEPVTPDTIAVPTDPATTPVPSPTASPVGRHRVRSWPVLLLALPAFVAIWSGWVGLGGLTGFGTVHPLPGIADDISLNTAITLPIGVETYAAYALRVWLSAQMPARVRRFAKWSAIGSLALGALGQVAYHLMAAAHVTSAPWPITTLVACLPVAVLGMGAALAHLQHHTDPAD